jgi:hypothetical protein
VNGSGKQSTLLLYGNKYSRKKFYIVGPSLFCSNISDKENELYNIDTRTYLMTFSRG